jgi:hypothetical protein
LESDGISLRRRGGCCNLMASLVVNVALGVPPSSFECKVSVPNSVTVLVLIGHLDLSGMRLGEAPGTDTKRNLFKRDWTNVMLRLC